MARSKLKRIICVSGLALLLFSAGGLSTRAVSADSVSTPRTAYSTNIQLQVVQKLEQQLQKLQSQYQNMTPQQKQQKVTITKKVVVKTPANHDKASAYKNSNHKHMAHKSNKSQKPRKRVVHKKVRTTRGKLMRDKLRAGARDLKLYREKLAQMNRPHTSRATYASDRKAMNKLEVGASYDMLLRRKIYLNDKAWKHGSNIKRQEAGYRNEAYRAINYDRESRGLQPVHYSRSMSTIASERAKQLTRRYSHTTAGGKTYMLIDAKQHHINWGPQIGENIDQKMVPGIDVEPTGQLYLPDSGYQMAEETEDLMVHHDTFIDRRTGKYNSPVKENNGHRKNILNKHAQSVGISVSYSPKKHSFFITENFHGTKKKHTGYHGKVHFHDYLKDKGFRSA